MINKNVLTQTEVLVCLRLIAPQDRDAVQAWIAAHGTEKQKDAFFESLASLPQGTAWFWSPGWLDLFKRVEVRDRETFDSSATPKVGQSAARPKKLAPVDLGKLSAEIAATSREPETERTGRIAPAGCRAQKGIGKANVGANGQN